MPQHYKPRASLLCLRSKCSCGIGSTPKVHRYKHIGMYGFEKLAGAAGIIVAYAGIDGKEGQMHCVVSGCKLA